MYIRYFDGDNLLCSIYPAFSSSLQLVSSPFSETRQSCKIKETNGFLQTACAEIYDGFAVYKCPYSDETYWIVDKLVFMRSNMFNATCSNDPFGYQVPNFAFFLPLR